MLQSIKNSIRQVFKDNGFNIVSIGPPPKKSLKANA